jgi:type VI secretion system protein ImpA
MQKISIDALLQPVSEEQPAGEDIAYDAALQELETIIRGKPETQFSPAEEPNWNDVGERSAGLLARSKNLRVAVMLCLALLKTGGVQGFREGIVLLRKLVEQYWETLYPRLDPDDGNDPLERMNILSSLVTPLGTFDDPMRFLQRLRESPLCSSSRIGKFSCAEIKGESSVGGAVEGGGKPLPTSAQVEAAFRDTDPAALEAISGAIAESVENVKGMDDFVTRTVGASRAIEWSPLVSTLNEMQKCLAPYVSTAAALTAEAESGAASGTGPGQAEGIPWEIRSRRDVVGALDRICDFYKRSEPSSPVPFLLRRARRLVEMDFMEVIGDLAPDALAPLRNITGDRSDGGASVTEEPAPQ